ncbi:MAG: hypothetical protein HUJ29_00245, partial [Gammaproteobacteria bacterium]|nr:hypothetical protein [Gammaproteobacteria bacterium]
QVVGWAAGVVLLLTIGAQTFKQWRCRSNDGVSPLLFIGQIVASTGFLIYAVVQRDPVFVATNALMLLSAVTGLVIMWRNDRERSEEPTRGLVERRV